MIKITLTTALLAVLLCGCATEAFRADEFWRTYDRTHDVAGGEAGTQ